MTKLSKHPDRGRADGFRRPQWLVLVAIGAMAVAYFLFIPRRISAEGRPGPRFQVPRFDAGMSTAFARLQAKPEFASLVFTGESFPAYDLVRPSRLEDWLGQCTVSATFYDRDGAKVSVPATPGPYFAVVEIIPSKERVSRRFFTLYRLAEPLPPEKAFQPSDAGELARALDVPIAAVERQKDLISERIRQRRYASVLNDPLVARVFAGLALTQTDEEPVRKWNDAEAAVRRSWLRWKRREWGRDARRGQPFEGPFPVDGPPATVLREGTLAEAGMRPGTDEAIDAVLREWAADTDQAFAVCIARRGVIVLHRAYGIRDGKPMTVATKSWMASVTKPMSATLMMMLVDDGRLTLDDRLSELLPPLRRFAAHRPITVRHLYTHTHGLDFWLKPSDDLPDFEERVVDCRPFVRPGRVWNYNGTGYVLGGKVIEALSGETIPEFYRKHLLGPLGCENTDVSGTHGDMRSIPLDIAKFGQMLLNEGAYGETRFMSAATFRLMLPRTLTSVLGPDAKKVFGIGLDGDEHQFGHGAASAATFRVNRDDELVVVMTRNAMGKNYDKYNGRFWDAIKAGIIR